MSERLAHRAETIEMVCEALQEEDTRKAGELVRGRYPFDPPAERRRSFSRLDRTRVFLRDGFIDRYSGDRLFFPPVLEVISMRIPDDFPTHPNGKFSECHVAHWELYASVDHVVPVARGGPRDGQLGHHLDDAQPHQEPLEAGGSGVGAPSARSRRMGRTHAMVRALRRSARGAIGPCPH